MLKRRHVVQAAVAVFASVIAFAVLAVLLGFAVQYGLGESANDSGWDAVLLFIAYCAPVPLAVLSAGVGLWVAGRVRHKRWP
jgi:uncharacterized membrane protein